VAVLNPGPRPGLGYGRAFGAKQVQQWLNGSSGVRVLAVWQVLRLRALRFAQDDSLWVGQQKTQIPCGNDNKEKQGLLYVFCEIALKENLWRRSRLVNTTPF